MYIGILAIGALELNLVQGHTDGASGPARKATCRSPETRRLRRADAGTCTFIIGAMTRIAVRCHGPPSEPGATSPAIHMICEALAKTVATAAGLGAYKGSRTGRLGASEGRPEPQSCEHYCVT